MRANLASCRRLDGCRGFHFRRSAGLLRKQRTGFPHETFADLYNGIDAAKFFASAARPASNLPKIRFGAVGRLVPAKDHVTLVRALALIASSLPEAQLHLLGEGPCRSAIAEVAASLGFSERVVLHGAGYDVAGFLSELDIFVLSSIDEGLPISLMEAMAAGLPVIATRLPGLPELAPENVVAGYCHPGQPRSLADLMLRIAGHPDLPGMGARAREWAQRFAIAETWRQYRSLLENALLKKVKHRPAVAL